jgi:hypothetical protein
MNPKYLPRDLPGKLDRIVEESSEVIQAVCKSHRFGLPSAAPGGGPNNAALILSEIADLRHAISVAEDELTERAAIVAGNVSLLWTNETITVKELKELLGDEDMTDEDFLDQHRFIPVCAGQWVREGLEYRIYKDPTFDA